PGLFVERGAKTSCNLRVVLHTSCATRVCPKRNSRQELHRPNRDLFRRCRSASGRLALSERGGAMAGVFISYRRADSQTWADRLADSLILRFGGGLIWRDVDDIPAGEPWPTEIRK